MHRMNTILLALILLLVVLQFSWGGHQHELADHPETKIEYRQSSTDDVGLQIAALSAEITTLRQEIALLSDRLLDKTAHAKVPENVAILPTQAKVESNVFFDELIAKGRLTKGDLMNIGVHLSHMDDSQKQLAMERLAAAINSKEVVLNEQGK